MNSHDLTNTRELLLITITSCFFECECIQYRMYRMVEMKNNQNKTDAIENECLTVLIPQILKDVLVSEW